MHLVRINNKLTKPKMVKNIITLILNERHLLEMYDQYCLNFKLKSLDLEDMPLNAELLVLVWR